MRVLPSGTAALLVELADLDQVLGFYTALSQAPPSGVVDLVPASRTLLVMIDPALTDLAATELAVRAVTPHGPRGRGSRVVELPTAYDGADLADAADLVGVDPAELVRRHTDERWTVAFCGFAPGFACRNSAVVVNPACSVALAGEFSGVYPRASPGGWQLLGRTDVAVFDLARDEPALLRPGTAVRFVEVTR